MAIIVMTNVQKSHWGMSRNEKLRGIRIHVYLIHIIHSKTRVVIERKIRYKLRYITKIIRLKFNRVTSRA